MSAIGEIISPKKVVRGSVKAGLSALDQAYLMAEKMVGTVVLADGVEKPVGIYTESDIPKISA
jgi:CBS domain-containing protein